MLSVLLRRFPRCYHSNHLIGADIQRLSMGNLSFSTLLAKDKKKSLTGIVGAKTMCQANTAREAAEHIVARLPEKEIKLVIRSFECAANRPNRITRLITRNKIDVGWMNKWFAALNDDVMTPLFPFNVPIPMGFDEARKAMFEAIKNANKFKNSDIFTDIARRKSSTELTTKVKDNGDNNAEILKYIDESLVSVPPLITMLLAETINEYSAEKVSLVSLKRSLRKFSGIHAYNLPTLFHLIDLPFNSLNLVTEGNAALDAYIVTLTKAIVACNTVTLLRRSRNVKKLIKGKMIDDIDPLSEAYLVSGSNPSTKDLLYDLQVDTELSIMMKDKVPARTVELRRRTLKSEHCLQITLECQTADSRRGNYDTEHHNFESRGGPDVTGGYDDFSAPVPAVALRPAFDWPATNIETMDSQATDSPEESEKPVKQHVSEAEWNNSPYKIFIDNIAPDVTDFDLIHSLRLCGTAKSVRFMKTSSGGILNSPPSLVKEKAPLTAEELHVKFGIKSDARPRTCVTGGLRNVLLPKNPLAVISSVKRRAIKKTIAQVIRNDSCAFALMSDEESYKKMTERDDVRIFGICVAGQNCRVKPFNKLTTIYLETRACISAQNVKSFLGVTLGNEHQFDVTDYWGNNGGRAGDANRLLEKAASHADTSFLNAKLMPVFVVLRFKAHSLAWEAYVKLSSAIEEGAPFKLSWTRTSWYYNVKAKAKEMQTINQILLEDIEHSEGRLDDSSAGDYLSTLGYEDEEEFDEHDPIVRTLKQIKPIEAITESSVPDPVPLEVEVITAAAPAPVKATPTPTPTVAACVVTEVVVKKKRRSAQEMLEAKEQKIAEKALKKSLKASPPPKASKAKTIAPPTPKASKTKTFTFPVLHEPVRRNHFYDSDGEIVTVKADKLRGY